MPESKSLLLRAYGESPQMRIIDYLTSFPKNDFTQKEIIGALGMSKTTFYRHFGSLVDFGMIRLNRKIANAKLYSVNMESPLIKSLKDDVNYISGMIADE